MKLINVMQYPDLPRTLLFQPAGVLMLPNSAEVSDFLAVNGSGVGGGAKSIKTALGEYFERRHFYREILPEKRGLLGESLTECEVESFAIAFTQTAPLIKSVEEIQQYEFALTEVLRGHDFSKCFIPSACISLSPHGLDKDNSLYPLRDTCGCSFHWQSDVAFLGAVKEYLERQFLLKFWLTKKCRSRVAPVLVAQLLSKRYVRHLFDILSASGYITFLDVSDNRFPGVCILAVYGQDKVDHHVRYCAGMSYALNCADALEKSLLELWQTFRFIDLFSALESDVSKLEDSYIRYFLSCNEFLTYQKVTDVDVDVGAQLVDLRIDFTLSGLLSVLKEQSISGYFYARRHKVGGVSCVFCKYISPDFFLHMNNASCFNLNNKFSQNFAGSILASRLKEMVPFP